MIASLDNVACTMVEQPACRAWLSARVGELDAVLLYDMPGLVFTRSEPAVIEEPVPSIVVETFARLTAAGVGLVVVHHAIAAWPSWPGYADMVGGRYLYSAGDVRGHAYPDSGYRHRVEHTIDVVAQHPITAGLPPTFTLTDELYLCPVFVDDVEPLLRTRANMADVTSFSSTSHALRTRRDGNDGWSHPVGSDLVGWMTHCDHSPVVYLQPGDGPSAYEHPMIRRLLGNALVWVASREARDWVEDRRATRGALRLDKGHTAQPW